MHSIEHLDDGRWSALAQAPLLTSKCTIQSGDNTMSETQTEDRLMTIKSSFRDFLDGDGVAVLDGAMGTMLYQRGVFIHRAFEELNLTEPSIVEDVHREYVAAGADIIETNTFGANRFKLQPFGLADKLVEINQVAVKLAKEAASDQAWVAGAMGPLGARIEPFGKISRDEASEVFEEQAIVLAEAGADLIVLETFTHLPELELAVAAVKRVCALPVIAHMRFASGAMTSEGVSAESVAQALGLAGADVVGMNCSEPLAGIDALLEMSESTTLPIIGQPNAGSPKSVGDRRIYLASADYMAAWTRRALSYGVRLVGGCCGCTPEHTRAMRQLLDERDGAVSSRGARVARPKASKPAAEPIPWSEKSVLAAALNDERFVLGVAYPAPVGWGLAMWRERVSARPWPARAS